MKVVKTCPKVLGKLRWVEKTSFGWRERSTDRVVRIFRSLRGWDGHRYWVLIILGGVNDSTQVELDDVGQEGFGTPCACVYIQGN